MDIGAGADSGDSGPSNQGFGRIDDAAGEPGIGGLGAQNYGKRSEEEDKGQGAAQFRPPRRDRNDPSSGVAILSTTAPYGRGSENGKFSVLSRDRRERSA
jgi:hypothetical protein